MENTPSLQQLLATNDRDTLLALFQFTPADGVDRIVLKFNLWGRKIFPKYFKAEDAWFHDRIDRHNCQVLLGEIDSFTDIAFRNAAKTTRTKLLFAFWVANDITRSRRYFKILAEDGGNSTQATTDIYNMLIDQQMLTLYPEIFAKTETKRQETMTTFTTSTGIKLLADTVGAAQRGQIQEDARPDIIWFDDFETRNTLKSPVKTKTIWDNMDEAIQGLAKPGGWIATCNYISERGNVHKLVEKADERNIVLIVPILTKEGMPNWPSRYTKEEAQNILDKAEYPEEYTQNPSASKDVLFDRASVEKQEKLEPQKEVAGMRIYRVYDPSHRYALGADVGGGVGLDSSTTVIIDFDTIPAQVVATYDNNELLPDIFGDEIARQGARYGECLVAPEKNNHGHATLARLKQIYPLDKIAKTQRKDDRVETQRPVEYGWETNGLTKSRMLAAISKAVENGHLALNDKRLIAEARSYTRNDLMDAEVDPRLTTRHYDLLMAAAIAWQHKDFAVVATPKDDTKSEYVPDKPLYGTINM